MAHPIGMTDMAEVRIIQKGPYLCLNDDTREDRSPKKQPPWIAGAWVIIAGFTLVRAVYSNMFLLVPDETNYWQWGRYLAWGYHDQAPLIGWAIRISTELFGSSEWAVRLPSVLSGAVISGYLVMMASRWLDSRAAFMTSLAVQSTLLFNVGSLLATPDGLQAAAWAGAAYHTARAYENGQWKQWLLAGMWFGFGMLSKYTMIIFAGSVFLYGLMTPLHRPRLMEIRAYIGVLLGFLMFSPVIYWNAAHNWNSVRHVAFIGGVNEQTFFQLRFIGDFFGSQVALLSPLMFFMVVAAWIRVACRSYRDHNWILRYLFFTSFPMIAGFTLLSLHARVYGNWPGAGYLTACLLVVAFYGDRRRPDWDYQPVGMGKKLWPWTIATAFLFSAVVLTQTVWPILPIPVSLDRTASETLGWDKLGQKTGEIVKTMPDMSRTFIFGLSYQMASELAFYVPGQPATVSINRWERPNVYDYWLKDDDLIGWDAVGVTYDPISHQTRLNQIFERVDPPEEIRVFRQAVMEQSSPDYVKSYYIYRAYGFKGGLRWVPEHAGDIRDQGSNR